MKYGVLVVGVVGLVGFSAVASAQSAPPARTGFQMDIRTGYSIPMGTAFGESSDQDTTKLTDIASGQVPVILDIGGKVIPELFVGGYLGLGFGSAGGDFKKLCDARGRKCSAVDVHLGFVIQYHILPAGSVNPWVGYGVGVESLGLSNVSTSNTTTDTATITGFEFARLMGGTDFRVSDVFGLGPFIDLSLAQYSTIKVGDRSTDISNTKMHEWLTLGIRGVFFP